MSKFISLKKFIIYFKSKMNSSKDLYPGLEQREHPKTHEGQQKSPQNEITEDNFIFEGASDSFQEQLSNISEEKANKIRKADIKILGEYVKEANYALGVVTCCLGCCFIFPWFLFCCGCWQKKIFPAFVIPQQTYKNLSLLFTKFRHLQVLNLTIVDNNFDKKKADILYQVLKESELKELTFVNFVMKYNYQDHEYSRFGTHISPIKSLPFKSKFYWRDKPFV